MLYKGRWSWSIGESASVRSAVRCTTLRRPWPPPAWLNVSLTSLAVNKLEPLIPLIVPFNVRYVPISPLEVLSTPSLILLRWICVDIANKGPPHLGSLVEVYATLLIAGGQAGLPIIILTFLFAKNVHRHPTVVNFCITMIIYSIVFCLLWVFSLLFRLKICIVDSVTGYMAATIVWNTLTTLCA